MLNCGVIGCGNGGGQVIVKVNDELKLDVLAINSSSDDLATLPGTISKILIGEAEGSGKDREVSKHYLAGKITEIMSNEGFKSFIDRDIIFVVFTTGGGTGSGIGLMLTDILRQSYPDTIFIPIAILPTLNEGLVTQINALACLKELYTINADGPYMIYDNQQKADLSSNKILGAVNDKIVQDIKTLIGFYMTPTKLDAIDPKELKTILSAPGRILVGGVYDAKDDDIEENKIVKEIITDMKDSSAPITKDSKVYGMGIISDLTERLFDHYDTGIPDVKDYLGEPAFPATHNSINESDAMPNVVAVIASGLSANNDRIESIQKQIEHLNEINKQHVSENNILAGVDIKSLSTSLNRNKKKEKPAEKIDISAIMNKYNI